MRVNRETLYDTLRRDLLSRPTLLRLGLPAPGSLVAALALEEYQSFLELTGRMPALKKLVEV